MTAFLHTYRIPLTLLIIVAFTFFAIDFLAKMRVADVQVHIEEKITDQRLVLTTLLEITARNGADDVTGSVIRDCNVEERKEFDVLLGRLDQNLSQVELTRLDRLFGRCGYFFAQRKSVMVARLARELELYEDFVAQLQTISGTSTYDAYAIEMWRALVQAEEKQSSLFTNLVLSQDNIIMLLLSGKSAHSTEMLTILKEVQENQRALTITGTQASDLRVELLPK